MPVMRLSQTYAAAVCMNNFEKNGLFTCCIYYYVLKSHKIEAHLEAVFQQMQLFGIASLQQLFCP